MLMVSMNLILMTIVKKGIFHYVLSNMSKFYRPLVKNV